MRTLVGFPRVVAVDAHRRIELCDGWQLCNTVPGSVTDPDALDRFTNAWSPAVVPGTVATALQLANPVELDRAPSLDAHDWWYRCEFAAVPNVVPGTRVLRFHGLATFAQVWLNGHPVLESENMFAAHEIDVTGLLAANNKLTIRFASVDAALGARRPRPRWRTKLVDHQQLRWVRTTLLGRMPGWCPPVHAVGPWRGITLEYRDNVAVQRGDVTTALASDGVGTVTADLEVRGLDGTHVTSAMLDVGGQQFALAAVAEAGHFIVRGTVLIPNVRAWWPHTHGDAALYDARVIVLTDRGSVVIDLGQVAFRRVDVVTEGGGFEIIVNGVPVFCRGACWTTPDILALGSTEDHYESLLLAARDAGMNMIRVGGTMVYESDAFYDCCDRLGILVWQDFMFASMDYPSDDAAFMRSVRDEVASNLARLRRHPSLAVVCGGSEVEQQAAMVGLPSVQWAGSMFHEVLPALCAEVAPNVAYWPSSPGGGAMPFHAEQGVTHYYGVGAYLRPLEDARRSNVRFASECLAFANVPEQSTVDALLTGGESPVHHARWKARVPRDHGAGWDFEDVRDHYLALLFNVDPMRLRYVDIQRYLALSRVATGEVMARTIGEWRRGASTCRGALVWFYQDLWAGAGWGLIDAFGRPKAAYYALKRAMQPLALSISDEGVNGLHVHAVNDSPTELEGVLQLTLYRNESTPVATRSVPMVVPARGTSWLSADAVLTQFMDVSYAYRFGPPGHDLVVATLCDSTGARIADAFHFPLGLPSTVREMPDLSVDVARCAGGSISLALRAERFAQSIEIDCAGATPDDNYFHMAPGSERFITLRPRAGEVAANGYVQPLNSRTGVCFAIAEAAGVSV